MKIVVSVVNYYKAEQVLKAYDSFHAFKINFDFMFSIVDNSCDVNNAEKLNILKNKKDVSLYISDFNLGYTKATNLSIRNVCKEDVDFVLILNPDIELSDSFNMEYAIETLISDSSIGILGVKQINADGSNAPVIRRFPNLMAQVLRRTLFKRLVFFNSIVSKYEASDLDWNKNQFVDWLQSSFWLIPYSVWTDVGELDERFYLFMSDPDYCLRAKEKGYSSFYDASLLAYADGKRASAGGMLKVFNSRVLRIHIFDAFKYYLKYMFK